MSPERWGEEGGTQSTILRISHQISNLFCVSGMSEVSYLPRLLDINLILLNICRKIENIKNDSTAVIFV